MKWRGTFTHHVTRYSWIVVVEAGNRFKARQECWRELAAYGAAEPTVEQWSLEGPEPLADPE